MGRSQRCRQAIASERADESHGLPGAMWCMRFERLPARMPAVGADHIGLHPCFINKYQSVRFDLILHAPLPDAAAALNVRAFLLFGEQRFF